MPNRASGVFAGIYYEAEIRCARFVENISVSNASENMEDMSSYLNLPQFGNRQSSRGYCTVKPGLPWTYCRNAPGGYGQPVIKALWNFRLSDTQERRDLDVLGGRLAIVDDVRAKFESQPCFSALPEHCSGFDRNIGSQLTFGCLISTSYQADSGAPQHQGDDGQKPFARLDTENRDFRSVLAAMVTLLVAT